MQGGGASGGLGGMGGNQSTSGENGMILIIDEQLGLFVHYGFTGDNQYYGS